VLDWSNSRNTIAHAATAGFSLLAIWLLVRLFWLLFAPAELTPSNVPGTLDKLNIPAAVHTIPISTYHLFGNFDNSAPLSHRDAPQSALNLQLRGLLASGDPAEGFAIIADGSGTEGVYRVGAKLPGNTSVEEIYNDRVVISRDGSFESLRLPGAGEGSPEHQWVVDAPSSAADAGMGPRILTVAMPQLRKQLGLNTGEMTNTYGLIPVSTGGYRLSLGRGATQIVELGLQSGDIIEAANGVRLNDQAAVENVIQQVMKGQRLNLQIRRNGQVQEIQADPAALMQSSNTVGKNE
jgi:general secretion pathway protein C